MTAFPVKRSGVRGLALLGLAWALAVPTGMAHAQDADEGADSVITAPAPIQLVPRSPLSGSAPSPVPQQTQPSFKLPESLGASVQVDSLSNVDPDSAGVLGPGEGGFPADMWADTPRPLVTQLLSRLPSTASSQAMRALLRQLLLTVATVPEGDGAPGELAALRVGVLAEMGELAGVEALLSAVPSRHSHAQLQRTEAEVRLLSGDHARACGLAAGRMDAGASSTDVFWNKLFIFCQALAGQTDAAGLGLSLLREVGEDDPAFFALIDGLIAGTPAVIESLAQPTPLHLAMARVAKVALPGDVIASNRPAVLRAIATSPNLPINVRLEAAERAESAGALPGDALRQLYESVPFKAKELASAVSIADKQRGPRSRALLYRAALAQSVPTARAEAVALALKLGREGGRFASTAAAFVTILLDIPPNRELEWFATDAVRALVVAGEADRAGAWVELLSERAAFDAQAAVRLHALMPLLRLAGAQAAADWREENLRAWWAAIRDGDGATDRAAMLFSLFEATGEEVPEDLWTGLLDHDAVRAPVVLPHPALLRRLQTAADAGRLAETVSLALIALGEEGPQQSHALVLQPVMAALSRLGQHRHARAIAVEAALAAGL